MLYKQLGTSLPASPLQHCSATRPSCSLAMCVGACAHTGLLCPALSTDPTAPTAGKTSQWALTAREHSQPCSPLLPVVAHTVSATAHMQMCDGHSVSCYVFPSTCSYAHRQFLKAAQAHTDKHTLLSLIRAQNHLLFAFSGTKERICRGIWTGWIIG